MLRFLGKVKKVAPRGRRTPPQFEQLESRIVPYSVSGNAWPHPELVTISFVPDGTIIGSGNTGYLYSNLFATFNSRFGATAAWQNLILRAAQTWAAQTNVNFALVNDNGTGSGWGYDQQGDPGMGDIRIGGYNFGNSNLAMAYQPPPVNNYSIAGDIKFNTAQPFVNGGNNGYDLFTVTAHEIGHGLGLNHASLYTAEMFGIYNGTKQLLTNDDIYGVRAVYSDGAARTPDSWGPNSSFATAANISSAIDPTTLKGDGWTATVGPGWTVQPGPRPGSFRVVRQ